MTTTTVIDGCAVATVDPNGTEYRRGAQDGPNVVRIGHLVEHDDGPAGSDLGQVLQRRLRQRCDLDQGSLMHRVGAQPALKVFWQHALMRQVPNCKGLLQAVLGVVSQIKLGDRAARIEECRLHRMDPKDQAVALVCWLPAPLRSPSRR